MTRRINHISDESILKELRTFPNQGVLWEIIEKNQTGKIVALSDNAVLVIENCSDPFVFIAGQLTDKAVTDVISVVRDLKFPMIYCPPKYHPLFLNHGWNFHLRAILSLKTLAEFEFSNQMISIRSIDTLDVFKKCRWYKERSELYGSDENFLKYGTGYVLCLKSEVVSEAYASIGRGYAEIGVITHPDYRDKGYAKLIISHLILKCMNAKITPKWSCNVDNRASLNTALRMGFEIEGYYTLLVPKIGNIK